jgi:site-specific recombinase XerD
MLTALDRRFIEEYDLHLRRDKHFSSTYIENHIIVLKKIVRRAIKHGTLRKDPFAGFIPERPITTRKYLTIEELQRLLNTTIEDKSLSHTRDMFLFSVFTGLSYIDIKNLSSRHIITDDKGYMWIKKRRQKTGIECSIMLLDMAIRIMDKYQSDRTDERIFRISGNTTVNKRLKEVAKLCGIDTYLSFHVARHTFATQICISQGIPITTLSKMLGHTKISTTQIYGKITCQKVGEDMKRLAERLKDNRA